MWIMASLGYRLIYSLSLTNGKRIKRFWKAAVTSWLICACLVSQVCIAASALFFLHHA